MLKLLHVEVCAKVIASCLFLHRESSEYSDWVGDAGVSLQPPKRKSKRQVKRRKLSSSEDDEEVEVVDDDDDDNYDEDSTRDSARSSSSRRQQPKRKKPPPPTRKKPSKNKRVRNHFRWPNWTNHHFSLFLIPELTNVFNLLSSLLPVLMYMHFYE